MKLNIRDINLSGKKVLMRVDFNVPMKNGEITDTNRIVQALPTINYALEQGAKVILFSHLGRVKEEKDLAKNDLAPVAVKLAELLGKPVKFVNATRGAELEEAINNNFTNLLKLIRAVNGDFVIADIQPKIEEYFSLLGFSQFFNLKPSVVEAVDYFLKKADPANSIFPKLGNCPYCKKMLRFEKPTKVLCPSCSSIVIIKEDGNAVLG